MNSQGDKNNNEKPNNQITNDVNTKLRPCCACPETKKLRDKCIFEKGEENCFEYIENHKKCLREKGFQVD